MNVLNNVELNEVQGGASYALWVILGGVASFLAGVFAGVINPTSCNK